MKIPDYVLKIVNELEKAGFEAYVVGGCVRDLLMERKPKDWDVTTNARPEQMLQIFPEAKYENVFGTVLMPVSKKREIRELKFLTKGLEVDNADKDRAIKIAKDYLNRIEDRTHGLEHSENVIKIISEIASDFPEINTDILEIAVYFHDVGRVKFDDLRHIEASQEITRKELKGFLDKKLIEIIAELVNHNYEIKPDNWERQLIIEADRLDGIDIDRCKIAISNGQTEHLEWLKENWVKPELFLTEKSKQILNESIDKFNREFDFKLPKLKEITDVVEVTTYRSEQGYSDRRHPDKIQFEDKLEKDLERRDFTINALALKELKIKNYELGIGEREITLGKEKYILIDLFGGLKDIDKKIIRAVGEPADRFKEDALRMLRAIRFSCQLGFEIEGKTQRAIAKLAGNVRFISAERIRDELIKIFETDRAYEGVVALQENKLLQYIIPELERGVGMKQKGHHLYSVFKHSLLSLKYTPSKDWQVKFASLLHDIAKPQARKIIGGEVTFYNHDILGAKIALKIMKRLRFSNEDMERISNLIRNHMFYYNVGEVTEASVRRLIRKVGKENLKDLIDLRIADRLGSGVPKAKPYKLRHLEYMLEKVQHDPVSVKMLKINGDDLMKLLDIAPGPKVGAILDILLSEVIEDPKLNTKEYLEKRSKELNALEPYELRAQAKEKIEEKKTEDDEELKKGFYVK